VNTYKYLLLIVGFAENCIMILRALVLIVIISLGLLSAPQAADAQKAGKVYRIGWLGPTYGIYHEVFLKKLGRLGWVEGQDFIMEYRSVEGKFDRLAEHAAELVALEVDLILTTLTPSTHAAKNATSTIPIVFTIVEDPVGEGLVASLARPGGNLTGLSNNIIEIAGKVLQLLNEAVPGASRVAYLWNPDLDRIARLALEEIQTAANTLGVELQSVKVTNAGDFEPAFSSMVNEQAQALVVLAGPLMVENTTRIVDLSLKNRLPLMVNGSSTWVQSGALMSYTPPYSPQFRRAARLVDKIFKGGNPGEIPVELPKIYDFAINLKTARELGITIPQSLLWANKVIE
jgi:putative ABC transport system substrate-binding protein